MALNSLYTIQLIDKAIEADEIARHINKFQNNLTLGAYNIFLGQVREDMKDGQPVDYIDYTSFKEMAENTLAKICLQAAEQFSISHVTIIHSLGLVKKGQLCLFVLVCGGHRQDIFTSCSYIVEQIKKEVPIWGKEVLADNTHLWKINTF